MFGTPFYHGVTRKIIIAFGDLFGNITIERCNNAGIVEQTIPVPVSYGNREKWYVRLTEEPNFDKKVAITLPRIGFEMLGISYDPERKLNKLTTLRTCGVNSMGEVNKAFAPVPYNVDFNVYVYTKTQDDGLRIIEQIIPFFTPSYTLSVNTYPDLNIVQDIPFNLNSVNLSDSFDGPTETRREIIWTLSFTAKAEYMGPIKKNDPAEVILHTRVKIDPSGETGRQINTDVVGDPANDFTIIEDYFDIPLPIVNDPPVGFFQFEESGDYILDEDGGTLKQES
jgi:hypothetical protein